MSSPQQPSIPLPATSGVFVSTLSAMHGGKVLGDLDDALREATAAANTAQTKASVTLKITIIPNGVGVGDTPLYKVEEDIKVARPKKKRQAQTFFADDNNNLTRRNPDQTEAPGLTMIEGGRIERIGAGQAVVKASGQ